MKFYFGGCSGVAGQDLANAQHDAFPALVSREFGAECINDARSGSSNQRIFNRAIQHIDSADLHCISWTSVDRWSLTMPKNLAEAHLTLSFADHEHLKRYAPFQDLGNLYYGFWYSPLKQFQQLLTLIYALQQTYVSVNKPYVMTMTSRNAWSMVTGNLDKFTEYVTNTGAKLSTAQYQQEHDLTQKLLKQINFDNFVNRGDFFLAELSSNYPVGVTKHPLEQCHRMYAENIIKHIRNNYESI